MSEHKNGRIKESVLFWIAGHLPSCEEVTEMASVSLERELTPGERVRMRLHFLICVWCRRYVRQLQTMRGVARAHAEGADTDAGGLSDEARERMKRALTKSPD